MKNKLNIIIVLFLISLTLGCKTEEKSQNNKNIAEPSTSLEGSGQFKVDENSSRISWAGTKPIGSLKMVN